MSCLEMVPLGEHVAAIAAAAGPGTLRTVDAIHLASALSVRDALTGFCCYDRRLLDAASDEGLPVHSPAG